MSAAICIHCQGSTGAICATPSGSAHWLCHFRAEMKLPRPHHTIEERWYPGAPDEYSYILIPKL